MERGMSPRRLAAAAAVMLAAVLACRSAARDVILATTTSTQDTGLLDSLVPRFERTCGCQVKTVAVGTGQALALGARGEADVVLVHAPSVELKYLEQGTFVGRRLVMTNDFVLVGPPADPAQVKQAGGIEEALRRIAQSRAPFASRGDSSGTNIFELKLWNKIGVPPGGDWYLDVGQGMGATLRVASQKSAYTISDRGTFLAQRKGLDLAIVLEGDGELLNIYHVMVPNPAKFPGVNQAGGAAFADFMVSPETQEFIREFGTSAYGQPLFHPEAGTSEEDIMRRAQGRDSSRH
jgi:tungstate transport system substrate-binding protein